MVYLQYCDCYIPVLSDFSIYLNPFRMLLLLVMDTLLNLIS